MNREKLFGLNPNYFTVGYAHLIKTAIFLRYGINPDQKISLSTKPSPIFKDLEIFQKGVGTQVKDDGVLVGIWSSSNGICTLFLGSRKKVKTIFA